MNPPGLELARTACASFQKCGRVSAMPEDLAKAFVAEKQARNRLRNRSAVEWLEAIQMIPEPNRCWCACLIWFDYCGEWRPEESDLFYELHLDHWTRDDPSTREQLVAGLRAAGYTPLMADQRVPLNINFPSGPISAAGPHGALRVSHTFGTSFELEPA